MSDIMLLGTLGMPLPDSNEDLDPLTYVQLVAAMRQAGERIINDAKRIDELERVLTVMHEQHIATVTQFAQDVSNSNVQFMKIEAAKKILEDAIKANDVSVLKEAIRQAYARLDLDE